eukprot:CAMPEP_0180239292 /NCGR_PEP_ID=MMETSP0987-20121128/31433_1 /TAXON_ID=697907 /ORGANISM="non described non described, Strain CCMP2293" /LENGTH=277 /DNA_ID=CAMNT_0022205971 /DNA_START=59 /DNA_END=889 /DNA_ORIENTATION=+
MTTSSASGRHDFEDPAKKEGRGSGGGHWRDLRGDYSNIAILLLLYTLQGVPMGLGASIPLLLQERGASFAAQSVFSLVSWPFSLKLLWAPIVDACFSERFGRRKSWLIPIQLLCAAVMLCFADTFEGYLGDGSSPPQVLPLSIGFFCLYLLMATQDIAVDGWALTMLAKRNVAWASTCNTTGQTAGYASAFIGFMALNSSDFCNAWLREPFGHAPSQSGAVSLGGFTKFWGWVFLVTTVSVALFKKEASSAGPASGREAGANAERTQRYEALPGASA